MSPDGTYDDAALFTIGQAARLTGLPVATIRYYSDAGLVAPAARTPGGYRLYDRDGLGRLELVRTCRELGIDLSTVARVLTGARTLTEVTHAEAEALETQIRTLRLRQAVLRHVAARGADSGEMALAHRLARLSATDRRRMVADLIDEATRGLEMDPEFAAHLRLNLPDLPDDPTVAQLEAWIELADLIGEPGFRTGVRRAFARHADDRASGADRGDPEKWRRAERAAVELAGEALAAGVPPDSARARPVVAALVAVFADSHGRENDDAFRTWLLERIRLGADPQVERYQALLATVGGRAAKTDVLPAARWFLTALEAAMKHG
ncbi:MerR family transcriptional regulator [Actinomadura sp. HBU206391]|uniref:MerR family transcriptional regulator n=1 Tax=Actinomadura sp. HBU206391 TaxID=2731692 RepID=UPI00164FA847|nr:MerR family transcriptional regulator [Actinomadura sp. HBU206391]MBC6456973.1 MerR family transcriptional regulator [Actinomadura sp. HBU206391]